MTNRLPYSTLAGNLAASDTFKQLIEYMVLISEDARKIANLRAVGGDADTALWWNKVANNFDKIATVVTHLAKGKTGSSVGFTKDRRV